MYVSAAVLGLAGAAAAAAAAAPVGPTYPVTKFSKGFRLVVNVTDASSDFDYLHHKYVYSIHDGNPGEEVLGYMEDPKGKAGKGPVFYLNGTHTDHYDNQVLTDFGDYTAGIVFDDANTYQPLGRKAHLYPDRGNAYFSLLHYGGHFPLLYPETWIACNEQFQNNKKVAKYIGFRQLAAAPDPKSGRYELKIPLGCGAVRLLPECAKLNAPPKGSATRQHVVDADCYPDVKSIDWSKYASE